MNEFNKKYLQIVKLYNYKLNKLICQENNIIDWFKNMAQSINDSCKNIINIIKAGPSTLFKVVNNWFNKANEKTITTYASMAKKLISIKYIKNIVTEQPEKISWFKSVCNYTVTYFKLLHSKEIIKKFIKYLIKEKNLTKNTWEQLQFSKKKQYFKSFAETEIIQNPIQEQIITEVSVSLIITLSLILAILITLPFVLWNIKKFWDYCILPPEKYKEKYPEQKINDKHAQINTNIKMQELEIKELTNTLKGCDALK